VQKEAINKEMFSAYDQLAMRSAFSQQPIEKPIEIEMLKLTSETRSDTVPFYNQEKDKMEERFTDFKNLNSRDTFFGKLENDIEFIMHDLNAHSSEVLRYLSMRKVRRMNWEKNRVEWVNQGLKLHDFQHYTVHYKDLHLGLTRSRKGWFAELMQTHIASVKSNLTPLLGKNIDSLQPTQKGIKGWFSKLGGVN